ncbi:hypothetical protein RHS01_02958 [Rhizoctonia solani]|uniref:Uncharacterized protein n=1 Tax=Rhizoctonia solani TaxID=456999 RepID=A0A8H7M907_9AGAM|nr:hypothetical protein RHS01_02958 [Rhizoctonia solani]
MDSSPYNGVIEMRLVTTPVASTSDPSLGGEGSSPGSNQQTGGTPLHPQISPKKYRVVTRPLREGSEVNAVALYGTPTSFRTSYNDSRGNIPPGSSLPSSRTYASGTVTPSRQTSDSHFDPLFAFAPSDISANHSVPASSSTIPYGQSSDYGATAYPTPRRSPDVDASLLLDLYPSVYVSSPTSQSAPPPPPVIRKRFPPRTTLVWAFVPLVQRYLAAGAGTLLFECRSYTTPPSPYASYSDDPSLDIIAQGGPYKRMVGYVGRLFDGGLAVYELADSVAATAAMDSVMLMGMAGVEAVGRGPAIAERGSSHSR